MPLSLWLLRVSAACFAVWSAAQFFSLVPDRVFYPGEIEWMEGGIQTHVVRVAEGLPLYQKPSLEFTPYIYTPFYYFLCAAIGKIFGYGLPVLRMVSLLSFIGSLSVILLWTLKRTRTVLPGLIGAGLFASTFRLGGAWFDIARGDSLLVFLLLLSGFLLLEFKGQKSALASALICVLAFLTKQSALLPLVALVTASLLSAEKRDRLFAAGTAFGFAVAWLSLHLTTGGWFTYYVFQMPAAHTLLEEWKLWFFQQDLLGVMAIASFAVVLEMAASTEDRKPWRSSLTFVAFSLGVVGMTWSSRIHLGMYDNVLMPTHALMGLCVALSLGRYKQMSRYGALQTALLLGSLGMLWNLEYPLEAQRPTEGHLSAQKAFVARLKALPRGTWVPYHSASARAAGLEPRAHWAALADVNGGGGPVRKKFAKEVEAWFKKHSAPAIVWSINEPSTAWFYEPMTRYYRRSGRIQGPFPLTGWGQTPREIWVPKTGAEQNR